MCIPSASKHWSRERRVIETLQVIAIIWKRANAESDGKLPDTAELRPIRNCIQNKKIFHRLWEGKKWNNRKTRKREKEEKENVPSVCRCLHTFTYTEHTDPNRSVYVNARVQARQSRSAVCYIQLVCWRSTLSYKRHGSMERIFSLNLQQQQ